MFRCEIRCVMLSACWITAARQCLTGLCLPEQLSWQAGFAQKRQIRLACTLAPFTNGPNHQRLTAPHVAAGKNNARCLVSGSVCFALPRPSRSSDNSSSMPSCTGCMNPMASKIRSAFSSNSDPAILHGFVNLGAGNGGGVPVFTFNAGGHYRKVANGTFFLAGRCAQLAANPTGEAFVFRWHGHDRCH